MTMRRWSHDPSDHVSAELLHHLADLNVNQRYAVECENKPMLVLAGPGSGKTLVLTMRIARLILEGANERFRILGLTFTRMAAEAMRHGVERLLDSESERARLVTFHSFCNEALRQHGSHLGLRPDFQVIAHDADRLQILRDVVRKSLLRDMPRMREQRMMTIIDHLLRDGYDGSDEAPPPYSDAGRGWIRNIYREYLDAQLRSNGLDFGTLVVCATRLFREHPQVAKHYRVVYPHVCVDEFQDTNKSQNLLLRALYPQGTTSIFAAADDDESMFRFRQYGANPIHIEELRQDYGMSVVRLPESYRSPPAFVALANNLIRLNDKQRVTATPPVVTSNRPNSPAVRVRRFSDHGAEAAWIANDIRVRSPDAGQCAVLARSKRLLGPVASALRSEGLSPHIVGRRNQFDSPFLQFVHSALLLANAPQDTEQIWTLCKAYLDLTGVDVKPEEVEAENLIGGGSPLRRFVDAAEPKSVAMANSIFLLESLRHELVEHTNYRNFYKLVFDWWSKLQRRLSDADPRSGDLEEVEVWNKLVRTEDTHLGSGATLSQFLHELDMRRISSSPKSEDILCLPVHLTKGREFEHAYFVGLTENQFPSFNTRDNDDDGPAIEEERRIYFMAITRVRFSLTLTHADSYFGCPRVPSRFLREMGLAEEVVEAPR